MTVLLIVVALLLGGAIILISYTILSTAGGASYRAYIYASRLLGDGLAEALSGNVWTSRMLLVGLYVVRGAGTAVLVWLTVVQLVKSPDTALTLIHAFKVTFTMGGMYVLALLTRACVRAETVIHPLADLGEGPIVLFLRSFPTDSSISDKMLVLGAPGYSEEQAMAALFGTVAPFVALARPRTAPELGAIRVPASDEEWHSTVISLVSRAKVVVVRMGATESLMWELQLLASRQPGLPVLFLLPEPPAEGEQDSYPALATLLAEYTGWDFPPTRDKARLLFFTAGGDAVLLKLLHLKDLYKSLTPFFEASSLWPKQITTPPMVLERVLAAGVILYFVLIALLLKTVGLRWGG